MDVMKLILRSVYMGLILVGGFTHSAQDVKIASDQAKSPSSLSKKYPRLSQYRGFDKWLSAREPSSKIEAVLYFINDLFSEYHEIKDAQERREFMQEWAAFIDENKGVLDKAHYDRYVGDLKRIQKEEEKAKKRNANRKNKMTPEFEKALESGDAKAVFAYLKENPQAINAVDEGGNNPLIMALEQEKWNVPMIKELIKRTKNLAFRNDIQQTALHAAADSSDPQAAAIVKLLLDRGAKIDVRDNNGATPLGYAIHNGTNMPVIETLVRNKANVKDAYGKGRSILVYALHPVLTDIKKRSEVCPDCKNIHAGLTPQEQFALLKLLVHYGADVNAGDTDTKPLVVAIQNNNEAAVDFLLSHKADIEASAPEISILQHAVVAYGYEDAKESDHEGQERKKRALGIIRLLFKRGVNPEGNNPAWTPLMIAVQLGLLPVVKLLVENGAHINVHLYGGSLLDHARFLLKNTQIKEQKQKYEAIIEYLIKHMPEYTQSKGAQEHAQLSAALTEKSDVLPKDIGSILEEFTAGPTKPSKVALNAIKEALRTNSHADFDALLNEDITSLELEDEAKDTPLLLAIKYNNRDGVATILTVVASMEEKDKQELLKKILSHVNAQGFNADSLAQELGNKEIIDLLNTAGGVEVHTKIPEPSAPIENIDRTSGFKASY